MCQIEEEVDDQRLEPRPEELASPLDISPEDDPGELALQLGVGLARVGEAGILERLLPAERRCQLSLSVPHAVGEGAGLEGQVQGRILDVDVLRLVGVLVMLIELVHDQVP